MALALIQAAIAHLIQYQLITNQAAYHHANSSSNISVSSIQLTFDLHILNRNEF
jgi:hypothetical protein